MQMFQYSFPPLPTFHSSSFSFLAMSLYIPIYLLASAFENLFATSEIDALTFLSITHHSGKSFRQLPPFLLI